MQSGNMAKLTVQRRMGKIENENSICTSGASKSIESLT